VAEISYYTSARPVLTYTEHDDPNSMNTQVGTAEMLLGYRRI